MSLYSEVSELDWREVGDAVRFGVAPDEFNGVELGRVRGQQLRADAITVLLEPAFDRFVDVTLQPIPDQGDRHARRAAKLPEKLKNMFAEARFGEDAEVSAHATAARRNRQGANDENLATRSAALHE